MWKLFKYAGILLLMSFLVFIVYCGYIIYEAREYTRGTIFLDIAKAQWRHPNGAAKKFEISSNDLSIRRTEILIKVQDPAFYRHNGIDLSTPGAGLTTLTQAITKKLYFNDFKPGVAKIKQSVIARFVVNDMISKSDQLTLFINTMYFGNVDEKPVVGLESAAQAYYRQAVNTLNESQYISLIAMIVAPSTFHLFNHPEWNMDRSKRIKALISGRYKPKGLMDQYYGELPQEVVSAGLPPASYFGK